MLIDDFLNYLRYERNYSNYTIGAYSKDLDQFQRYVREHREGVFNPGEIDSDFVRSWIRQFDGREAFSRIGKPEIKFFEIIFLSFS